MRDRIFHVLGIAFRLIVIGFFGSVALATVWVLVNNWIAEAPNRAAAAVLTAARDQKADVLAPYMDSARLEASFKSEVGAAIEWRKANPLQANPLQMLFGTMLTLMLVPEVLTAPVEPDGVKNVQDTAKAAKSLLAPERPEPALDVTMAAHGLAQTNGFVKFIPAALAFAQAKLPGPDGDMRDFVRRRIGKPDDNTRIVTLSPDGFDYFVQSLETKLIFERRGMLNWVIVGVDLPDDGGVLFQPAPENKTPEPAATPP